VFCGAELLEEVSLNKVRDKKTTSRFLRLLLKNLLLAVKGQGKRQYSIGILDQRPVKAKCLLSL
jgi:hypothetical protein